MKKTIGPREAQVRLLRERRAAGAQRAASAARVGRLRALVHSVTGVVPTPKPIIAPVQASAHPRETAMSKKSKAKKPAPKKRSVSQAAANLKAARARAKSIKKSAKPAKAAAGSESDGPRPGSKAAAVAALLTRPEGCTAKDILTATGWPTVSVPQQAKAAGLTLRKEKNPGQPTTYFGQAA